ncbi:hypothetical protein LCGC14_0430500 [marine sediment metagenome]|uniref:Uncharacterized protein n=1 Tax=marine sediment metagenome TaxID=412755 RepID=A0A0F9T6C9_9ZZZZ
MGAIAPEANVDLLPGYNDLAGRAKTGITKWALLSGDGPKTFADLLTVTAAELKKINGIGSGALKGIFAWRDSLVASTKGRPKQEKLTEITVKHKCGFIYLQQIEEEGQDGSLELSDLILCADGANGEITSIETSVTAFTMITHTTPYESTKYRVNHTPQEVLDKILAARPE